MKKNIEITILFGALLLFLSLSLIYIELRERNLFKYKTRDFKKTQCKMLKIYYIMFLIGSLTLCYAYYMYLNYSKNIAKALLSEKSKDTFNLLCDEMFKSTEDTTLLDQYLSMKSSRSVYEVNNLCQNMAKNILRLK